MEQKPRYRIHPLLALVTVVLNFWVLYKLPSQKRVGVFEDSPSVMFYILLISGAVVTFSVAIPIFRDLFRYAGDHPWYMKYIVIYLILFALLYIFTIADWLL